MNRLGEAERLASEVLRAERGNVLAASLLGQSLLTQNRPGEAIAPLEKAARRSGDPSLETLLAIALASSGQRDAALAQLRKTTARRPFFPPAFRELASQLAKSGENEQAIATLETCLAQTPDLVELQMDLAALHLGRNERVRARAALTKALAVAPGRPDVLALLARIMVLDGEYASAADAYRQALAQRPDDANDARGVRGLPDGDGPARVTAKPICARRCAIGRSSCLSRSIRWRRPGMAASSCARAQ